jgi:Polyketide cyclase / dehydrase and lipid transport
MSTMRVRHIGVTIDRPFDEVFAFLAEPANFERWASGLGRGLTHIEERSWRVDSPEGPVIVRFSAPNSHGVVDHEVATPAGERILNPMRVIPNGSGCEVVFTLFQRPGVSDETFKTDAQWVTRDLQSLKRLLE